jgi:hypothetical protein
MSEEERRFYVRCNVVDKRTGKNRKDCGSPPRREDMIHSSVTTEALFSLWNY